MSYDTYITRRALWFERDGEGTPITEDEWTAILATDPEFTAKEDEPLAVWWHAWPGYDPNDPETDLTWTPEFWHDRGNVQFMADDERVIQKALALAAQLGAAVQGEDGEILDPDGTIYSVDPDTGERTIVDDPWTSDKYWATPEARPDPPARTWVQRLMFWRR